MKKSMKRFLTCTISLSLTLALAAPFTLAASTQEVQGPDFVTLMDPSPRFDHITEITSSLKFTSAGRANCGGVVTLRHDYDCTMTLTLQQNKNGDWVAVKTWSQDFSGSGLKVMDKGYYPASGYQYCVKTTVEIKDSNGTIIESITCTSPTQDY